MAIMVEQVRSAAQAHGCRRVGRRGLCLRALAGLLLALPSPGSAQPVAFDEQRLAGITATGASTAPPGRPVTDESGGDGRSADDARRSTLAVNGVVRVDEAGVVRLGAGSQEGARALNLINAAGADVGQGLNVLDLGEAGTGALHAAQSNQVAQTAVSDGRLGRFSVDGSSRAHVLHSGGTAEQSVDRRSRVQNTDRFLRSRITTTRLRAEAEPVRIGFFDAPGVTLDAGSVDLPGFSFRLQPFDVSFTRTEDGPLARWWSDRLSVLPRLGASVARTIGDRTLSVSAGSASLGFGGIRLVGSDVILETPTLHLPSLSFDVCLHNIGCGDGALHGSLTRIRLPSIDFGLGSELTIADANPLGELGYDVGYAVAGDGSIRVDPGSLSFAGGLSLDLGRLFEKPYSGTLSADTYGLLGEGFGGFVANFDVPEFELAVDEQIALPAPDGFNRVIDGETCVFSAAATGCAPTVTETQTSERHEAGSSTLSLSESSHAVTRFHVEGTRERGAVSLRAAEGDLLVFRDAAASERRYRVVVIDGGAQRGARALNAANLAGTLIGNGLNVIAVPPSASRGGSSPGAALSQSNTFTQIGGQP